MNIPKDLIHRPHYLLQIQPFIGKGLIKVLTGQRRVGKSYLLFQLMLHIRQADPNAHILYLNKEDMAFDAIRTASELHAWVLENMAATGITYLFIDEIQDIAQFEQALRSLLLRERLDIYCTGSNANLLSGELATLLSGRFIEFTVHSLSYLEFLDFHQLSDSQEALTLYMKYGGLPYLVHLPKQDAVVFEYLTSIYSTIIYRDVVQRNGLRNTVMLERLVAFLAGNIGSLFSTQKISEYLKAQRTNMSVTQLQILLAHLKNAFVLQQAKRYDIVGKRIFEIGEKWYFENLGLRNAIVGYKPEDLGKMMENAVYNHLVYLGYTVWVGVQNQHEIDFVCEKQGEKLYVQVALTLHAPQTIAREFGNLLNIPDNYPKMLVTMDGFSGNTHEGIPCLSLREFLRGNWW